MPLIAIGGAVLAGVIAAPTIGAVLGGAALTLTGALEITAAVGATLGAIGAVTKDKGLQTAGLIIGGIGAVGSLASAAGLIDGTTTLFGGSGVGSAASDVAFAQSGAAADVASGASFDGIAPSVDITPAVLRNAGVAAPTTPVDVIGALTAPQNNALVSDAGQVNTDVVSPTQALAQQTGTTTGQATSLAPDAAKTIVGGPAAEPTVPNAGLDAENAAAKSLEASKPSGLSGALNGISTFAQKNPMVAYGILQTAGSFVSGAFNPVTPAQVDALNAQAEANRANAKVTQKQADNMAGGIPIAHLKPVTVAPVTGKPGLINSPVTGVAA